MRHSCEIAVADESHHNLILLARASCSFLLPSSRDSLIKGTLATIYRQRGSFDDCEAVLDVELEVLARYQRSSEGACAAQVCGACCRCSSRRADRELHVHSQRAFMLTFGVSLMMNKLC